MPKNIEDIIPSGRRSIRNIPIPKRREVPKVVESPAEEETPRLRIVDEPEDVERPEMPKRVKRGSRRGFAWAGGAVALVIVGFLIYAASAGATLSYKPKTADLTFNKDSYTAYQDASSGHLAYSVVKLSGDKSTSVPATGDESVSVKASGTVVIYNQQSVSQPLVKTTRLETSDGKIYRIQNDVTIPAKGSIEVVAVADQAGADYNIPLSDFTIPGFKGKPQFETVYARSKTTMTGGFVGTRKKVSDADLTTAKATLESELKSDLLSEARAQMPLDYVLFPDLSSISYSIIPDTSTGGTTATVKEHADLNAAIFKRSDLAQYLTVSKLGASNVGSAVEIPDYSKLNLAFVGGIAPDLTKADSIQIIVVGTAQARFITDERALAADLAGVRKADLDSILKRYPSIDTASVRFRPFWRSAFPTEPSKIKIERQ